MTERRLAQVAWLARLALALVFIWHGLAPKILWLSPDEVAMIGAHHLPDHPLFAPQVIAIIAVWPRFSWVSCCSRCVAIVGPCWSRARYC